MGLDSIFVHAFPINFLTITNKCCSWSNFEASSVTETVDSNVRINPVLACISSSSTGFFCDKDNLKSCVIGSATYNATKLLGRFANTKTLHVEIGSFGIN